MADIETKVFHIEALREFSTRVFLHFGVPQEEAAQAADVLASADLAALIRMASPGCTPTLTCSVKAASIPNRKSRRFAQR
jgi:hypothetical protein